MQLLNDLLALERQLILVKRGDQIAQLLIHIELLQVLSYDRVERVPKLM